ncbi:hypothetical protein EMIHUDRAFT_123978, partial [Emiliania huxleyi CCMP1516]|uniref:Uncharacterized protein n=2 Tax=Emiliania huxleyi TaxID=2903 RepID=A0A0D3J7Z3_EMIH1
VGEGPRGAELRSEWPAALALRPDLAELARLKRELRIPDSLAHVAAAQDVLLDPGCSDLRPFAEKHSLMGGPKGRSESKLWRDLFRVLKKLGWHSPPAVAIDASRPADEAGDLGRSGEIWGDLGRSGEIWEIWGDMGRSGEIWGDMERYGEMWGDVGRSGEIWTCTRAGLPQALIHNLQLLLRVGDRRGGCASRTQTAFSTLAVAVEGLRDPSLHLLAACVRHDVKAFARGPELVKSALERIVETQRQMLALGLIADGDIARPDLISRKIRKADVAA